MLSALVAAGGVSRIAPFLPVSLQAGQAAPKRILCVYSPMGYLENSFWPTGSSTAFTLGETMTALEPWKRHLLYVDGLTIYGARWFFGGDDNEHGTGSAMVFTGAKKLNYANGPSVDQAIADFQFQKNPTKFHSLCLGVNSGAPNPHNSVFYRKAQTPVKVQSNPQLAFDEIFRDFTKPVEHETTIALRRRQSSLDFVSAQLKRIRKLSGTRGRVQLDAHLERIGDLESKLDSLYSTTDPKPNATCDKPMSIMTSTLDETVHAQMDLIVAAFACDMSRAACLQLGVNQGGLDVIPTVAQDSIPAALGDHGNDSVALENHKIFDRWFAARWAYLLNKLDSVPEGSGTMLDNTLVLFGSDTTTLQNLGFGAHFVERIPMWIAGGRNFAFKTGQTVKLPMPAVLPQSLNDVAAWVPHQRLLTSVCQAFGMNVDKFGDNDPGHGPLTHLTRA